MGHSGTGAAFWLGRTEVDICVGLDWDMGKMVGPCRELIDIQLHENGKAHLFKC